MQIDELWMIFQPHDCLEVQLQISSVYQNSAYWNNIYQHVQLIRQHTKVKKKFINLNPKPIIISSEKKDNKMKYVSKEVATSEASVANKSQIDWNDFNYPICLKIYHYDATETPQVHRRKVMLFRVNHTLIILATFINLIANIAGAAQGVPDGGIRIGISIFLFFFWIPWAFQIFFLPYHIIMKDQGKPMFFYILSAIVTIWFAIWSIADFADANGFVMVGKNFNSGRGAAGFFGIITAIFMLVIAILTPINVVLFCRR